MAAAAVDQPHDGALRDAQPADARLAAHHSGFILDLRRLALGGARRVAGPELMTRLPVDRHLYFSIHLKGLVLVGSSSVSSIHHDRSGKRCLLKGPWNQCDKDQPSQFARTGLFLRLAAWARIH